MDTSTDPSRAPDLDQARLQQRLEDAGTICGRVAHAFDNILTGILGFAELSLSQVGTNAPVYPYLEEVIRAAQQGVQMTQQLHLFGRGATDSAGPAELAAIVMDEEARFRAGLPEKVELRLELAPDVPALAIDPELLRQILGHLLDNAREAVGDEGSVSLSARRLPAPPAPGGEGTLLLGQPAGPCVELAVSDSGGPLSPEVRRRLFFEPFFTTKPRHRGLGLAIVYRIVSAHKGGILLDSRANRQTTVRVFLPLASAPTAQHPRGAHA